MRVALRLGMGVWMVVVRVWGLGVAHLWAWVSWRWCWRAGMMFIVGCVVGFFGRGLGRRG